MLCSSIAHDPWMPDVFPQALPGEEREQEQDVVLDLVFGGLDPWMADVLS